MFIIFKKIEISDLKQWSDKTPSPPFLEVVAKGTLSHSTYYFWPI